MQPLLRSLLSRRITPLAASVVAGLAVAALSSAPAGAVPDVAFPDGVASGEVTPTSAVLWARVDQATPLKVEVSEDPGFQGPAAFKQTVHPSPSDGLTVHALATDLAPNTRYYYRWRHGSATSPVGEFRTAPEANVPADVRFVFTADSDNLQQFVDGNTFQVLNQALTEDPDFWVYLGDTIYSDSSLRPAPALTLDEYRDAYQQNRTLAALRNILAGTSTYAIWDDHEVQNDYSGQTVDPTRYANGRRAFLDYMPMIESNLPEDPSCAGDPLFRTFSWGSSVDVFVLDERSCRSADAQAACATSPATVDLAPTLPNFAPPFDFRTQFRNGLLAAGVPLAQVDLLLPLVPSAACTATIYDPSRTVLGPVQKQALKDALVASTAPVKVIVNEYPIQQFYALPYDRWEGYSGERAEILSFIRDHVSGQVLFATTDTHANLYNAVAVDRFLSPVPVGFEVVTGPIATFTFGEELAGFAADLGLPAAFVVQAFHQLLSIGGVQCRNLDVDSYALVDVDAGAGTLAVSSRDENGNLVHNSNPLDPGNTAPCVFP